MSDIENNTNDLNINTTIDGNAASGTAELSAELVNLTKQLQQLSQAAVKQANVTQSWNQAMGMSKAGVSQYSQQLNSSINVITKLSNATKIYKDVLNEAKKSTEGFVQAQSLINSNKGGLDTSFVQRYNAGLVQGQNHLSSMTSGSKDLEKAMKRVALIDISRNISRGAQAESNAAYAFTRNFSTPIIGALRESFFSYSKLASESVRTTKLILDNFSNLVDASGDTTEQMAKATEFTAKLGKELDKVTQSWGTSRVLVQALAGDFAELGITSADLLADMTRLTVEAEKLGNLDIAQSSSFLTSMYQTILRIRRETGKSVNINDAVVAKDIMEQLSGQLAIFNLIENKTVMSLRNISDAFPEVTAAATSFGLSMSEATALIIPMIGAGFQVGASANSLKVSLQRMVAMTKQNTTILNQLNQSLGNGFELSAGVGMDQIQKLSDAYGFLVRDVAKGGKGKQGALELFSRLFGVRQGPRMESAFAQLNAFQTQLETTGSAEQKVAKQLQDSVNVELKAIGQKEINIKQFKDLSTLHRAAIATDAKGNLTTQAAAIKKGQIEAQRILEKAGGDQSDFISEMSTEVGKALVTQAFDTASLAGRQYDAELKLSQNTPEVRYRRAKESLLALGRSIVPVVDSILKALLPAFQKLSSFLQNNPAIAKLTGAFLLLAASIGPIRLAFATMKTVFGGAISFFVVMTEKITGVSYAFASLQDLMSNPDLLRGQDKVVQYLDNFLIKTRRNGKSLRKEMDLTGLSQPVQEMFKGNKAAAIYGTDRAVNMKRLSPIVPETSQFLNDMKTLNIENSTQMAAKVASGSEKGIAKGAEGFSDKFAEAAARAMHRFQGPNLFAGPNYFEGNIPGDGGSSVARAIGSGGGGGGGKAAAKIAAEQATVTAATQSTFQKNIKRQINDFFLNPLGIGNMAQGGPTPGKTDGLLDSVKKVLNTVKGQSSSSPPGGIGLGTAGTSGVLLSTLKKIQEGMPKSMSGRIVRDVSQSYGFPLTGQGRIPYPSTSVQEIFPRAAVTSADKLKRQMLFAPKQLMPAPPPVFNPAQLLANINNNRTALGRNPLGPVAMERYLSKATDNVKLSFAQIREWYVDSGRVITSQLDEVFSQGGVFTVSQSTFDSAKKAIFDPKRKNFLNASILDERKGGLASITGLRSFDKKFRTEMGPIIAAVSDSVDKQVSDGLNQTLEELSAFQRTKLVTRTRMGEKSNLVQRLLDGKKVNLTELRAAEKDLFINVLENGRIVVEEEFGGLNTFADDLERMKRDVRAKKASFKKTKTQKGVQQIEFIPSGKGSSAAELAIRDSDVAAIKATDAPLPFTMTDKKAGKGKGQTWDRSLIDSQTVKSEKELQTILSGLKKNINDATTPKQTLAALEELDEFLFLQERYAIADRIKLSEDARRSSQGGEIAKVKKTISDLKKQKAAALRKITEDSKSALANGTQFVQPPVNFADLDARYEGVKEFEQELNQEMLGKREALRIAHQAELDNANRILTQEMTAASSPAAKQKLEKQGLEKLASLKAMHADELLFIEREIEDNRRIISNARSRLDTSPASYDSQIYDAETKLKQISPSTDLSDAERLLIKERKELNRQIKKAGYVAPSRPTADILTLEDRIAKLNAPVDTSKVQFVEDLSRAERVAARNAAAYAAARVRAEEVITSPVPIPQSSALGRGTRRRSGVAQLRDSILPTLPPSRFFGPQFDQARIPSVTDFYGKPFRLKDYPLKSSFAQRLFKRPKSVGAAAITTGTDIAAQFRDGLESSLNGVLKSSSSEVSKITSAIDAVIFNTGHSAAGKKTIAFLESAVKLPDKIINQAMQAAITDITRGFTGGTGAGLAGRGSRAQSPQSLAGFYERLRLGLSGKNARGEATKVKGITEAFFGPDFRALFNKKPGFSDATGVENNLKVIFANAMKNAVVGLGSGKEALSDVETGRRKEREILQASQGRQRSTRGGVQANRKRSGARGKGVKGAVAEAVGDVNQELIDVRTQLAGSLQGLLDQKRVIIPDVAAQMQASIVDPIEEFHQDITSSLDEGVKVITGDVKAIDIPNVDGIKETIINQVGEVQDQIDDAINDAVDAIPNKTKGPKSLSKTAQKTLDKARKEIDSSTSRAGEILKVKNPTKENAALRIKKLSDMVAREEKDLAAAIAAATTANPDITEDALNKRSNIKGPRSRLKSFKKEIKDLEKYINQSLLIEQEKARLLDVSRAKTNILPATGMGTTGPVAPPPEGKGEKKPARVVRKTRVRGEPIVGGGGSDGDGKIFNIDKIGHRFQGPNIFSKNIFDANLKDIIPNFDDFMAAPAAGAAAIGVAGETAGVAITEGAAAMTAASAVIKQNAVSKALFGNKALMGQFAEGQKKDVIESLFGSKMNKKNIIPEYVTNKLEDGTESTVLSSATRRRSLLPFGKIPIGLPIKQDLADVDKLLTKGVLPNFTRLKKLLTGALGKTWLFALSGGLSVLIGPLTKVLKNFGGLKQVFAGTATIFAQSGSMLKGVAAGAGQITSNVFGGIQKVGKIGLDIFAKLAGAVLLVGTAFLIIVPVIGILIALYGMFKSANGRLAGAATALKEAFKALVDGAKALFAPVRDLIFVFTGANKEMGGLTSEGQKNAAFFTIIANAIKKATTAFKEWAETIGAAFVKNTVVPQITRIINKFILLGSAIKDFSSGDKDSGMAKLKAMMFSFAYDIVSIVRIITGALINAFVFAVPVIIQVMQGLLKLLGEMIWAAMKEIGSGVAEGAAVGMIRGAIGSVAGGDALLKVNDAIYNAFAGSEPDGAGSLASSSKTKTDTKGVEKVIPKQLTKAEAQTKGFIDSMMAIVKSAGVGVDNAFLEMLKSIDSKYTKALSSTNIKVNGINVPIVIDKKSSTGVIDQIAYIAKKSADAATSAGESLGSQIANGIKSKVAEIKDTLKGAFYSNVDEKFDDIVTQYTDALEKQKDQQLKAYDDQITAIDELAAAEERLTDTKDYESRKREIIDKRQYDHENYSVERKLAVYEGRTFDVRRLDREEVASKVESDKSLTDLDSERLKTLQSFQRDLVKGVIANQKDIAEKEFDVILKSFDTFMKGVKNKSFATQEEFAAALKGVADKALSTSLELGTAFETGLAKLPAAIAAVRTPSIALFSSAMGDLIGEANTAFGVATGSANSASLLGAVGLLVAGSQAGFAAAFSTTFAPLYVQPAVDAITVITGSLSKKGDPNNIAESWKKAGADAFAALEAELNRTIAWEKIFKSFDDLFTGLKPKIKKVVDLAVAAQNALANVGGQTAVSTELDEATMKDFKEVITESAKTYGGGKFGASKASLDIMIDRVAKFIGTHISEGAAGIIASAKDASSGLSVTEKGILTAAVGKLNIGGALNLIANPSAYRTDSGGRSGFGATSEFAPYYPPSGYMHGGQVGRYGIGGYLKAPASQGIPALLHGGEYIINHKAVEKFGKGNLERINNLKNGGDFRGFASGGYMTTPGFANGGYMTTPGFAKGGAVKKNVGKKPKQSDSNQINNGMKLFTNSSGQSYYVPDTNVRSGANSGMILHPLDWQAIAVSENGQNWENSLGKISRTGKGVFVGALNIARQNWMRFGQGKYGNFNDPLNPPSFENQIKVAEIMYKGLASDTSAWGRAPKYLDGFEGVRLGRVDFPKLSDLSTYNRLKAQGLALGGSVRKYGSADAMERASAPPKFIGPMPPVVKPTKQGVFGKVGGFLSRAITDTTQSFAKIGSGGLNIAASLVESPFALLDKRLSFNPITNLQRRNQDQIDNGINYIRGINKITGLNIPGGKTGGLGQIAGGKLTNFGDAFNVITSIPGLGSGFKVAAPIGRLAVAKMGLSATEMTLGQIMKPGVMAVMNNALARETSTLVGSRILAARNPASMISNSMNDGLRSAESFLGRGNIERDVLDLYDELDRLAGVTAFRVGNADDKLLQRLMVKAQLQMTGEMPNLLRSESDMFMWNEYINKLLNFQKTNPKALDDKFGMNEIFNIMGGSDENELSPGLFNMFNRIFSSPTSSAVASDPRIIPESAEVFLQSVNQKSISDLIRKYLQNKGGSTGTAEGMSFYDQIGGIFGMKRGQSWNLLEIPQTNLPKGEQGFDILERTKGIYTGMSKIKDKLGRFIPSRSSKSIWQGIEESNIGGINFANGDGAGGIKGLFNKVGNKTKSFLSPVKSQFDKYFPSTAALSKYRGGKATTLAPQASMPRIPGNALDIYRSNSLIPDTLNLPIITKKYGGYGSDESVIERSLHSYKLGLEKVIFGDRERASSLVDNSYKLVDINPYEITGISKYTKKGVDVANDYVAAHAGYKIDNPFLYENISTQVEAYFYDAYRNNNVTAMQEIRRLISIANSSKELPGVVGNGVKKPGSIYGFPDFSIDDIMLTHETKPKHPIKFDKFGNANIRPISDYPIFYPKDDDYGKLTGKLLEQQRNSVHFALNHLVTGHEQRQSLPGTQIITTSLKDFIKYNPDSLSNLNAVDSWASSPPGAGLTFPRGTFKVLDKEISQEGYGTSFGERLRDAFKNLLNKDDVLQVFGGTYASETFGFDHQISQIAKSLNIGSGLHNSTAEQMFDRYPPGSGISDFAKIFFDSSASRNSIARFVDMKDFWSGMITKITDPSSAMYNGGYMPKFKKGGYLKFKEGGEVPSILHGGEYVLNAGAVKKYGIAHIEAMNKMRFNVPQPGFSVPQSSFSGSLAGGMTTSTQNVNIYVDNFIGEPEWFNSMMKDYNTTVLPRNQKAAGLESRVISTYSGLNRGN